MDGSNLDMDQCIAELVGMGFQMSEVDKAVKEVGPSLNNAIEFILNSSRNVKGVSTSSNCSTGRDKVLGKRSLSSLHPFDRTRQLSITDHLQPASRSKIIKTSNDSAVSISGAQFLSRSADESGFLQPTNSYQKTNPQTSLIPSHCKDEEIGIDWEHRVKQLLYHHFGYSSLKTFQKEALAAWVAHKDCLVLAATGSGKSLCFQIPALLTGKVVVVISPLISLMHDQCMKLAKHGVSACFLGSGQIDFSIEQKAMKGMYGIIYVCPETILRLIQPLQSLAQSRGIALFAIDEVHCVSKWGHDFRPDYRRLSALRENFKAETLKFLKFDIPIMALTATATIHVREDLLKSLHMSEESTIVLTSFFRPNLRFSVKHSRTSSPSSYEKDFSELIDLYTRKKTCGEKHNLAEETVDSLFDSNLTTNGSTSKPDSMYKNNLDYTDDSTSSESDHELRLLTKKCSMASKGKELSVEYLEDECDLLQDVYDWDVTCGEFYGQSPANDSGVSAFAERTNMPSKGEEKIELLQGPLDQGSTIIYVPTRKETLRIAKFLCKCGVKAAAYHAKLPKSHLRRVHMEFHENTIEVVVATIAFGMGIDKLNVRRIIHYGWPQSLEAYYQEAGRAGRDGKVADCVLYANLSRIPSLLPSQRSEEQTRQAYRMLSDCFRYGIRSSICRAKTLVQYFGEEFIQGNCQLCDICVKGPPERQDLRAEAQIFMQVIAAHYRKSSYGEGSYYDDEYGGSRHQRCMEKPSIKMIVSRIREESPLHREEFWKLMEAVYEDMNQFKQFTSSDLLWWQGLARILEDKGFVQEGDEKVLPRRLVVSQGPRWPSQMALRVVKVRVQIKFPEPTGLGLEFMQMKSDKPFYVYPEADMLLSLTECKSNATFAEWGKGWADPEIRRQRLERSRPGRRPHQRKSRKRQPDLKTVRGRLAAKLSK